MLRVSAPTVCVSWGVYMEIEADAPCKRSYCVFLEVIILSGRVYGVMGLLAEDHLILWLHAFQAFKSLKVFLSDFVSRL